MCARAAARNYNWTTLNRTLCFWRVFRTATDCYCKSVECGEMSRRAASVELDESPAKRYHLSAAEMGR